MKGSLQGEESGSVGATLISPLAGDFLMTCPMKLQVLYFCFKGES